MKLADIKYKLKYGKKAFRYRTEIERIFQIIEQEKADDLIHWWYKINQPHISIKLLAEMLDYHQGKMGFSMFEHGMYAVKYNPYSWMYASNIKEEAFTFSIDEFLMMIKFARNAKQRDENVKSLEIIQRESKELGFVLEKRPEYKQLIENVRRTEENMKQILNPVSRKFNDLRETEECLSEYLPMLLGAPITAVQPDFQAEPLQLESLRQLTEVVHNQYVSEKTKKEAESLIQEIQNSLNQADKQKLEESAEMNALAIIQASRQVHALPKK